MLHLLSNTEYLLNIIPVQPRGAVAPNGKKVDALIITPAGARVRKRPVLGRAIILRTFIITLG